MVKYAQVRLGQVNRVWLLLCLINTAATIHGTSSTRVSTGSGDVVKNRRYCGATSTGTVLLVVSTIVSFGTYVDYGSLLTAVYQLTVVD